MAFNTCVGVHGKCARIAGQDLREADGASDSDLRDFAQTSGMESKSQDGEKTSLSLVGFCRVLFGGQKNNLWPFKNIL